MVVGKERASQLASKCINSVQSTMEVYDNFQTERLIGMAVCDICGAPGTGTILSADDMRTAVFKKGFNPFAMGLVRSVAPTNTAFEGWKNTIVAQDTSDWNVCAGCMLRLRPYLEGKPKPTGVTTSRVSTSPVVGALAAKEVEEKIKRKKRWQFWKR
jgi:hypothetical protein